MNRFAQLTGRQYRLFDYDGAPDAERVIVMMGSGCEAAQETVAALCSTGEKVGLLKVRLYRPFAVDRFVAALPPTVKTIAVLDRTKEPGGIGEPLYLDVVTALSEGLASGAAPFKTLPRVIGGRYGLSSKEFTPAMVKGVFDELAKPEMKNHFSLGINDDVTMTSLSYDPNFNTEPKDQVRALFWGLGADGTVSANKNSIKIIGEETPNYAQGYFVYDSKKSGAMTVSHLRFGPQPIKSTYLIQRANFIAVHQFNFLERYPVLESAVEGATLLLNSPYEAGEVWDRLPRSVQQTIIDKHIKVFAINADAVAKETQMGNRINTIMQTCFFAISGVLPREEAITRIKESIRKTYGKRGEPVVRQNFAAVDAALEHLHEIQTTAEATSTTELPAGRFRAGSRFCAARSPPRSSPVAAICCRSARFRLTALFRSARRNGRSATSRRKCRSGKPICASSVASACWSARTQRFAPRWSRQRNSTARPQASNTCRQSGASCPISATRFRSRSKIARAAGSASRFVRPKTRATFRERR